MMRYSSLCSSYDYGNAEYWNTRYLEEAGASFDWYQRYSALRPFVRKFVPSSSRILMVGCGIARTSSSSFLPSLKWFFCPIILQLGLLALQFLCTLFNIFCCTVNEVFFKQ
ncbi:hypothetical protein MA16_Dca022945 [Dendrobium catenatum]|uniref:Uncharacterized protein n=1 Tax=Dendrobium catenatum TaxID=906689 RepID=A0A2I0XFP3_9ASPA|nr:hypothetical protein MA16_Dca022945 [Dendrobium catenatum]